MDCSHHQGTSATAICTRCDQPLCATCTKDRNGRNFCAKCAEFLDRRGAPRPQPAAASAPPPVPGVYQGPAPDGDVYQEPATSAPAASDVYQGPAATPQPDGDVYQGPAATPQPDGDVYQGPAATGDVYQGPTPPGEDAPQGDVYQGDMYQGDAQPATPTGVTISGGGVTVSSKGEGSTGRAVLFGLGVGVISAGVWYAAVVFTGFKFAFLAIVIGWLVGAAVTAGAARADAGVALLSMAIAAGSMIGADYMINDHYYRKLNSVELLAEEAFADGDISVEDIALYFDTSVPELRAELSEQELDEFRQFILEETEIDAYDYDEPERPAHLPLGELFVWMEWWEYVFIGIGAFTAFRVPMGE
ncbi:MAG: hypothetical protein GY719_35800 [bacterium]|nr:hypothetical protein [bacterium]